MVEKAIAGDFSALFQQATSLYAQNYNQAVGGVLSNPEPGQSLYPWLAQFSHNTSNLAAWKAHRMATELIGLKEEADIRLAIKKYNQWQAVEYNAITARTRTARQLLDFQTRSQLYPNLEWIRSRAANPREQHLALVGLVLPINDPFWNDNQPGNLYGCTCDWKQTDATVSTVKPAEVPPSPGLDGSPLNTGQLITRSAGHFASQSNKVVKNAIIESLGENQWMQLTADTGLNIKTHLLHGANELKQNLEVLNDFLKVQKGVTACRFLPIIHTESGKLKPRFYPPGQYPKIKSRNADAVVQFKDGKEWVVDFKITGSPSFQRALRDSAQQAKYAVIKLGPDYPLGYEELVNKVNLQIKNGSLLGVFIFNHEGNLVYSKY